MLDFLNTVPAVVRILIIFALILMAIKRKWMLGNAFIAGSMALGVVFGMGPVDIARSAAAALVHPKTLSLSIVVGLILVLSHSLEQSGQMGRLLENFKGLVRQPRINIVIFPALIGLLPMPGGAIFSAPMVKNIGEGHRLSGSHLSYVNYWFRHIWEYWWPLYPGILLATTLAEVDLWQMVLFTFPLSAVAVIAGYWPLKDIALHRALEAGGTEPRRIGPFLRELQPIGFAIAGGVGLGLLLPYGLPHRTAALAKEIGLILALLIAIVWVWRANDLPWHRRLAILRQPALFKMLYMVSAILVFKGVLEQSGAVLQISREMLRWQIPLLTITIILPMLVGGVSGITIAFVGATFPILVSLIQAMQQTHLMLPYMMLAMASGFVGVLISPLHLCLLLSNEYFHTSLVPVYQHMRVPLIAMLTAAAAYFGGLYYWLE
jgi:integral membrane protein (TIGR00529 family)